MLTQATLMTIASLVIFLFYINERMKRQRMEKAYNRLSVRTCQLSHDRDELAKKYLLAIINPKKIRHVKKEPSSPLLSFCTSSSLQGLVASNLNDEEIEAMNVADSLLDGHIPRDGNTFQIPGDVTGAEKKLFSR